MNLFLCVNDSFYCRIRRNLRVVHLFFRRIRCDYFNTNYRRV
jgi:hypothetical protein